MANPVMRLALQRKLATDRGRWRTIGRFDSSKKPSVVRLCKELSSVLEPISWRLVIDDEFQDVVVEFK